MIFSSDGAETSAVAAGAAEAAGAPRLLDAAIHASMEIAQKQCLI
jgi:hypothetical protein